MNQFEKTYVLYCEKHKHFYNDNNGSSSIGQAKLYLTLECAIEAAEATALRSTKFCYKPKTAIISLVNDEDLT